MAPSSTRAGSSSPGTLLTYNGLRRSGENPQLLQMPGVLTPHPNHRCSPRPQWQKIAASGSGDKRQSLDWLSAYHFQELSTHLRRKNALKLALRSPDAPCTRDRRGCRTAKSKAEKRQGRRLWSGRKPTDRQCQGPDLQEAGRVYNPQPSGQSAWHACDRYGSLPESNQESSTLKKHSDQRQTGRETNAERNSQTSRLLDYQNLLPTGHPPTYPPGRSLNPGKFSGEINLKPGRSMSR